MSELQYPDDIMYTKEHTWLRLHDDGTAEVGISDYAQTQLGEVAYVDLPNVGATFASGAEFGTVESLKAVNALFMPAAGEVLAVNDELGGTPTLVNMEPYGQGWMLRVRVAADADLSLLCKAGEYSGWLATL